MSKSVWKSNYKSKNQAQKEDDSEQMKKAFENMSYYFHEMYNNINASNSKPQKLTQLYKCFSDEINTIKNIIERLLSEKSKNTASQDFKNNIKEISPKISPNIRKFENPTKQLYQTYGIHLETIESKSKNIRDYIEKYSLQFEDVERDISKRNKYLETVANIAVFAEEYSYKLIEILLGEFNKRNKFSTIIYEKAKEEFSSWVNQSLKIDSSQEIGFFEEYCSNEFKLLTLNKTEKDNSFIQCYNRLFIDIVELFTLAIIYSEREINIKYIEKGKKYQQDEMKDITNLNKIRYVNFTVLPGLCVNQKFFQFAKAIVFCEQDSNLKLKFNIKASKKQNLKLNETIKTKEINDKLKLYFECKKQKDLIVFTIITCPDIPENDNPLFLFKYYKSTGWIIYQKGMNQKIFYIKRSDIPRNSYITFDVQINGGKKINNEYVISTEKILSS